MEGSVRFITSQFYGKRKQSSLSHMAEKRERLMQSNPLSLSEPPSILGDSQIWRTFQRQSTAIEFATKMGMSLMTFAFEGKITGDGGKRSFLVCHPRVLWNRMCNRPLSSRCTYEVIPEEHICKLYFDLEFLYSLNPNVNGVRLTKTFISIVNHYLLKEFSINCGVEDVLDLDSTTDKKFSRHLIYNSLKVVFANNSHVGRFVKMICDDLRRAFQQNWNPGIPNISQSDIETLFVKSESSLVIFCDEGVYSKNRNFRIYKSTKFGKQTPLLISPENQYTPVSSTNEHHYFLDSLVTFIADDINVLTYGESSNPHPITPERGKGVISENSHLSSNSTVSPYVEIECYINSFLGEDNLIRSWRYFSQTELLVFEIDKRHKFCNNIGREHKSNSIMYVVNLQKGVFYQKCYDPSCHGYKSNEIPLPPETMPWNLWDSDSLSFDSSSASEDDLLLMEIVDRIEEEEQIKSGKMNASVKQPILGFEEGAENTPVRITKSCNLSQSSQTDSILQSLPSPWNHLSQFESLSREINTQTTNEKKIQCSSLCDNTLNNSFSVISDEEMLSISY